MLEAPRTSARSLATRRPRDVDVYGGEEGGTSPAPNIFAVVWRRRWIVLFCVLLSIAASIGYYTQAQRVYSSTSTLYVQDNALKMVVDPMSVGGRSQQFQFTQCQLITSSALLATVIQKPEMAQVKMLQGVDNPIGLLKSCVSAVPDRNSDLINVTCESANPQDAAAVANAVVEAYSDYQNRQHKSTTVDVLRIFQKEVAVQDENLRKTQRAILELKKSNPDLTFVTTTGNMVTSKLGELSARLTQAQLRALDLRTAGAEAEVVKDDPVALRRLIDQFDVGNEAESGDPNLLAEYRASRERLMALTEGSLGAKHTLVRQVEKQVGRMEQELAEATRQAAASYSSLLKHSEKIAASRVTELASLMSETRKSAVDLNFKQAEFDQLRKDEERITRSLDLLDNRVKELNVNEDVGSMTVSVLESAKAAFVPVRPVRTKVIGMGLAAGLMAGVGLAMLRDLLDQRLRSASEITALLELPILGVVPHVIPKSKTDPAGRMVELYPRSTVAESYRSIRTAVSFGAGEAVKTLLVTSPAPGDGKSTCSSNIAIAFAQSGRRTLLIDADCRRPTQDRVYGIASGAAGLSDVLEGRATLQDAIHKTNSPKLDLLPSGTIPNNPAELLDSQELLDMLGNLSAEYDQIIIDSPPVSLVTDARILAASCDAVVLVLRAERSTRRPAEHARDSLYAVGANLIGLIVNDVPRGKEGQGYDYYSYGKYGYGYNKAANGRVSANGEHVSNGAVVVQARTLDA